MKNSIKDYLEISKIFIKYHLRFKDIIFIIVNWAFSKIVSLPFILFIYISLPINRKMYLFFRKINLYVQLRVNYFVKSDLAQIESNLENILKIEKNRKKIATLALLNKELQNDLYNELFLKLIDVDGYIKNGKNMKINNYSDIPIENIGVDKKVIFCHSHSGNMTFSVSKICSLTNTSLNTLLIQRGYSKSMYSFFNSVISSLGARNLEYYDPFKDSSLSLLKKVKKSNIIHLYVDLPIYVSLKNFSSTKIQLFDKQATVNASAAQLAMSFDALCIPVFTNKNEIDILKPIDTNLFHNRDKEEKIKDIMQLIFNQLSVYWEKYPQEWCLLGSAEYFFKSVKF